MFIYLYVSLGCGIFFLILWFFLSSKWLWDSFLVRHYIYGWLFRQKQQSIKYHEHTVLLSVIFIAFLSQMIAFKSSKTLLLNLPMEYGLLRFSFWEIYGNFLSLSFTLTFKLFVMDTALKKKQKRSNPW